MSRVRDKADFQFAGEDYTHGGGVRYVANAITTTDLDASGTISNIHLQDIADVASVTASNDGYFLKYDHGTTAFVWSQVSGGGGGTMNDLVDDTTPQLGGTLDANGNSIDMGTNILTDTNLGQFITAYGWGDHSGLYLPIGGGTLGGSLTVTGNFTVNGTTTTINTTELTVSDNIITLNNDETGTPSQNAGIAVERGTSSNVDIRWNETTDKWEFTNDGATYSDIGSGGDVVDDTTPQLGGDLDVNGNSIEYTFSLSGSASPNYVFSDTGTNFFSTSANNPTLYLTRGVKYAFTNIAGSHPFRIQSQNSVGGSLYNTGVTNNNGTGTVTFTPPMNAPDELYYYCSVHSTMKGIIKIVGGGASTGDISFSASTISSSGTTVTVNDNLSVTGSITSSQAGAPILTSASSITLQAATNSRVHVDQSPLRLYNVTTTNRGNITASDGDLVYDSDVDSVFAFQNGSWTDIGGTFDGIKSKFTVTAALSPSFPSSGEAIIYSSYASGNTGIIIHGSGSNNVLQVRNGNSATDLMTVASDGDILASGSYTGSIKERSNADTTTTGTLNFNSKLFEIYRLTQNQTANRTLNIRGDGSTTLDSIMSNNEFRTVAVAFKNGGTPYYINSVTIDGASVTPLWSGGSAPSAGNASSTDFYTFSIVKTGSATFEVYGTFTKYA